METPQLSWFVSLFWYTTITEVYFGVFPGWNYRDSLHCFYVSFVEKKDFRYRKWPTSLRLEYCKRKDIQVLHKNYQRQLWLIHASLVTALLWTTLYWMHAGVFQEIYSATGLHNEKTWRPFNVLLLVLIPFAAKGVRDESSFLLIIASLASLGQCLFTVQAVWTWCIPLYIDVKEGI
ncbi:9779_t:CDS:2 [Ambispora gerdemannii]|uniref:9779_t:CDS:1 n=1 Tax=Ambispora gerdemannii TaxID=144530 RepID=A0A9N9FZU9_9GLOM|nr:9779_t:CDS:2 [Ambispora gerdemannii]